MGSLLYKTYKQMKRLIGVKQLRKGPVYISEEVVVEMVMSVHFYTRLNLSFLVLHIEGAVVLLETIAHLCMIIVKRDITFKTATSKGPRKHASNFSRVTVLTETNVSSPT